MHTTDRSAAPPVRFASDIAVCRTLASSASFQRATQVMRNYRQHLRPRGVDEEVISRYHAHVKKTCGVLRPWTHQIRRGSLIFESGERPDRALQRLILLVEVSLGDFEVCSQDRQQ